MPTTSPERKSTSDVARDRAAFRDIVPAVVALVVLQVSLIMLDPDGGASTWNLVWSLLPLVPVAWLIWAQVRNLRRSDEYQRVVQLEAMAIGFGAAMVLSLTGGLLDGAGIGNPRQSLQITFIGATLAWLLSLAYLSRRSA